MKDRGIIIIREAERLYLVGAMQRPGFYTVFNALDVSVQIEWVEAAKARSRGYLGLYGITKRAWWSPAGLKSHRITNVNLPSSRKIP